MILTVYKAYLFCAMLVALPLCIATYLVERCEINEDIDLAQLQEIN